MQDQKNLIGKINETLTQSITLKLLIITFLTLLLLIPGSMIQSIIHERISLRDAAIEEVSDKWAKAQEIAGPVLTIPALFVQYQDNEPTLVQQNVYLLPDALIVNGDVDPKSLKRGIYEVKVYNSKLTFSGSFDFQKMTEIENLRNILWDQAFITLGISDLRGIQEQIVFTWNNQAYSVEPGSKIAQNIPSGITFDLPVLQENPSEPIPFSFDLDLRGSQTLSFIPAGKTTRVSLNSRWEHPSFYGNFLPNEREVTDEGFTASWSVLQLNRNYPQLWSGDQMFQKLPASSFGVALLPAMDDYQKSMRIVKYGIMTIALTFLIYFLVEIRNKKRIHPIQYTFVGLALSLFYILMVSISEHLGFNLAYWIAALIIILMVYLYSITVFRNRKLSLILMASLVAMFSFLFVNLQLTEYALLLGSIGLTLILAVTMYLTRNIDWYQTKNKLN